MKNMYIPQRTIMTPGPVEIHPHVATALSNRTLGQFDPAFLDIMDQVKEMIKIPFGTTNEQAFAVDGTSRSGIEASLQALINSGDKVLVPAYGRFAYLIVEIAQRLGAEVILMEKEWDDPFEQEAIIRALEEHQPKIIAMVHGETANGQVQSLEKIGAYCQNNDVLLLVDMVATYGGMKIELDAWGVDIAIAGSQKCVSAPSGLSLVTFNKRTEDLINQRYQKELGLGNDQRNENPIKSNYLDLSQLIRYWGQERINHHTESTHLIYALYAGLSVMIEEGMDQVIERHRLNDQAIMAGIKALGLEIYGNPATKMPTVTPIVIPEGVEGDSVKDLLLTEFGVEIAGSFGPLKGKIWRIGNMGYSSRKENVLQVLSALEACLRYVGAPISSNSSAGAALQIYKG